MIEGIAFVSFLALVAAWLAAPKDTLAGVTVPAAASTPSASSSMPVAEAQA
ncbi:MAG: hypothetical protein ACR2J8_02305 [Thermomicrobiales bacterium]